MTSAPRASSPLKWLLMVSAACLLSTGAVQARYGAFVYSTGGGSFGAYGLSWNWRTPNAAVRSATRTARHYNGGGLDGYRYVWWSRRGFEAGARGYDYYGDYVRFGWARGWRTRRSAINYAVRRLGYHTYDLGYASGFNR